MNVFGMTTIAAPTFGTISLFAQGDYYIHNQMRKAEAKASKLSGEANGTKETKSE
jgi:hypothetical protein